MEPGLNFESADVDKFSRGEYTMSQEGYQEKIPGNVSSLICYQFLQPGVWKMKLSRVIYVASIAVLLLSSLAVLPTPSMAQQQLPDLVILRAWQIDSQIGYSVKNIGKGSVGGATAPASFYNILFIDGKQVAEDHITTSLAPGQQLDRYFEYQLTPGQHTIRVCADWRQNITESDEGNNCWEEVWAIEEEKLPDLMVDKIECGSGNKLSVTIKNIGTGAIPSGWKALADTYFNGARKGAFDLTYPTSILNGGIDNPGGSSTYLPGWDITAPVTVRVIADFTDDIRESNEQNNIREEKVAPTRIALPDLVVEDIRQEDDSICYKIKNAGEGSVASPTGGMVTFCNALFIDGGLVAKDYIDTYGIHPGIGIDACFDYQWQMAPPQHTIKVCADSEQNIDEENEGNNCLEETWYMEEKLPDLIVERIECSADNKLSVTIKNIGAGAIPSGWKALADTYFAQVRKGAFDLTYPESTLNGGIEKPGGSSAYFTEWDITAPVTVRVVVDFTDDIKESNEQNNSKEEKIAPISTKLPDLVITNILCDEEEGRIGYEIKNVGNRVAPAGHKTALFETAALPGGKALDEDEVDVSLDPGDTYQGYFENYKLTSTVGITICADHYDDVAEASEDNNCLMGECEYVHKEEGPPPPTELLPDLIVDPYYSISYLADTPEVLGFYYRIWNRGSAPAPATWTELYLNGTKVAEQRVEPLNAGERRDERIPEVWDCTLCTEDRIEFRLDARDEVVEEAELNNNHVERWTCSYLSLPGIDLAVENIHFDSTDGKIKYMLSNRGAGDSLVTHSHLWVEGRRVESRRIAPLAGGHSREEYFNYRWQCTYNEDTIRVVVDPVIRVIEDCSGVEIGLGELDTRNNRAEVTWECELPELIIERIWLDGDIVNYIITNQSRYPAGPSTTGLHLRDGGEVVYQSSDEVAGLAPGESRQESFSEPCSCTPPYVLIDLQADENESVIETDEGNWRRYEWWCGPADRPDLAIERIWLEDMSTLFYEIKNEGGRTAPPTTTEIHIVCTPSCHHGYYDIGRYMQQEEPELHSGESRTVSLDVSYALGNWCRCKRLFVRVEADYDLDIYASPGENDILRATFDNPCTDGIQNQGEQGIDCGGPCPARCRDCFADADFGSAEHAGYFCLGSPGAVVLNKARQALQEYANCLRNPSDRATLEVTDPLMDFSTVTVAHLEQSTDYIMEAVAYYVDQHTDYMYDDHDCPVCDSGGGWALNPSGAINAEDMILETASRDGCGNNYCGDCEDHAILREALMRSLGVSWRCAFCADHYDSYWGGGHTFNLVYYRNKWRIMDYDPLGHYFPIDKYWGAHNPDNVWNDHVGEYWCPGWRSDPACWYCCNHDPYSETQNYNGGEVCCSGSDCSYYEECAP